MKTTIHSYRYDLNKPADAEAYKDLKRTLEGQGLKCFRTWGGNSHYHGNNGPVILKTDFFFNNQWNTAEDSPTVPNRRVFDWAEDYTETAIRVGHYLDVTPEMVALRKETFKCPYCGKMYPGEHGTFCLACLDSAYLDEKRILGGGLRLRAIADENAPWQPLTEAEAAELLPLFREAQAHGITERGKARLAERRAEIEAEYKNTIANAEAKRDGFNWLMDRGINTENVIWYDHARSFSFGWRNRLDAATADALRAALEGFPAAYTIELA